MNAAFFGLAFTPALKLKTLNPQSDAFKFTITGVKRRINQVRHQVREAAREAEMFAKAH